MKKVCCIAILLVELVLMACSNSESLQDSHTPVEYLDTLSLEEMVLIRSKGKSVSLGTEDESAPIKERPSMKVSFDYDYLIGMHEVTCGEIGLECDDSLPANEVTLYEAMLYANRRSVEEGFDTAYSYTMAFFDEAGICTSLEGLKFDPRKNAYRLPTEAEWVYAASLDWHPEQSWNNANSDYKLHKICTSGINSDGLCDMAGNAMEWVGDVLVSFKNSSVVDYVGGRNNGGFEERVLKGGSFRNDPAFISLHGRGDVYTVTSASKAPYVGFRLAFGAIPNPVFLDEQGRSAEFENSLLARNRDLRAFVGKPQSKLVFRDDFSGNLLYVDFRSAKPGMQEINTGVSAYHPEISPDGKFVAYCTGQEGVSGPSKVYVAGLDENAGLQVELPVKSAAIPRWRVLGNGDTAIVYVTETGNNKESSAFMSQETWQVRFSGGTFATPEKLFDGAFHGGVSENGNLAVTGARLLRSKIRGKDEVWYNGEQACNVSLSRGGANQTLFLDFGSKTGRAFVGTEYGTHEQALIVDSTGRLISSVASPDGFSFDHTEWAYGSDSFFVATLSNANGKHGKIVLVNVSTKEMMPLVEGEELWYPSFWMQDYANQSSWDFDSLGYYYTENGQSTHYLPQKMAIMWKYRDSAEVACMGNSHVQAAIAVNMMSKFAVNLSAVPCDMHCVEYLYENYVSVHMKELKYLVVGLDMDLWIDEQPDACIQVNMGDAIGFKYDIDHHFWQDGVDSVFANRAYEIATADPIMAYIRRDRGWLKQECIADWGAGGTGYAEILVDSTQSDDARGYESNYAQLIKVLEIAQQHGVTVVGVVFPISPYYKNTGSYGRYGLRRSTAKMLMERLEKLAAENDYFVLMDENKMGNHDYLGDVSFDYDHLCKSGAEKLTMRLDSLLKTLDNR